jgi:glyoxylase-like metal-dependent hydrolase (beta-lactamase superfamily II)/rhodanese-related sulfurtransferase
MEIKQFDDKNLAHYSYAISSRDEMVLIDPARDPQPYLDYANARKASIIAIIETHPHADFVSGHLELAQRTGAHIYVSKDLGAEYTHKAVREGDAIHLGDCRIKVLETPGHSPDSISLLLLDEQQKEHAVFTGDSLFIGDCGRPDLRENAGNFTAKREDLAKQMYHTLRNTFMKLPNDVLVYPAHGAGSLCGKGMSDANSSTIGAEKMSNWSMQKMDETAFVAELLSNQPFVPKYFAYNVALNKKGAPALAPALEKIPYKMAIEAELTEGSLVIDSRSAAAFNSGHIEGAINLMEGGKFETWLGSIVGPDETFSLIAKDMETAKALVYRIAKIGYEDKVAQVMLGDKGHEQATAFPADRLTTTPGDYTILDIRNPSETHGNQLFENALTIPLYELRERTGELPTDKPIVVHCAGGYRSAAGSSIVRAAVGNTPVVYDLSEAVKNFQ